MAPDALRSHRGCHSRHRAGQTRYAQRVPSLGYWIVNARAVDLALVPQNEMAPDGRPEPSRLLSRHRVWVGSAREGWPLAVNRSLTRSLNTALISGLARVICERTLSRSCHGRPPSLEILRARHAHRCARARAHFLPAFLTEALFRLCPVGRHGAHSALPRGRVRSAITCPYGSRLSQHIGSTRLPLSGARRGQPVGAVRASL